MGEAQKLRDATAVEAKRLRDAAAEQAEMLRAATDEEARRLREFAADDAQKLREATDEQARRLERHARGPSVEALFADERARSHHYGGRSVFSLEPPPIAPSAAGEDIH